jgi:hypothetical protein
MWPFTGYRHQHEEAILSQFITSEHEMTAMDIHRRTNLPFDTVDRVLRRMERDGKLTSRFSEQAAKREWRKQRLYKIK